MCLIVMNSVYMDINRLLCSSFYLNLVLGKKPFLMTKARESFFCIYDK